MRLRSTRDAHVGANLVFALLLLVVAPAATASGTGPAAPEGSSIATLIPMLRALDRTINVEFGKVSPRDAFAELARVGGIPIDVDPAVRNDVEINAILKGVRLGDALSLLCRNCGLRLLPGNGRLVVAPVPVVIVATGNQAAVRTTAVPDPDPWQAWTKLTGLQFASAGETGYPQVALTRVPASGGIPKSGLTCGNCRGPVLAQWAFCPQCGKQRLPLQAEGKFCTACGRPHGSMLMAPAAVPAVTPPPLLVPTLAGPPKQGR